MHDRNPENAFNFVSQLIVSLIDSYQQDWQAQPKTRSRFDFNQTRPRRHSA